MTKEPFDASLTIRLTKTLREDAHAKATEQGKDLSDVLRDFLKSYAKS